MQDGDQTSSTKRAPSPEDPIPAVEHSDSDLDNKNGSNRSSSGSSSRSSSSGSSSRSSSGSSTKRLNPRPSTSPDDPLNWSWGKKHAVLTALIPGCLLSDWTLTWGTTVFHMQAPEWGMSVEEVSHSVSPGIALQGLGGLVAVPLCERYGRLPVLFYSQLLSLAATLGAMYAPSYGAFTAFRALQGFFGAPPQVIGMCVVHDLFFFDDRARKVNIWAASFLVGPYLGPLFSSLLVLRLGWRDDFGILAALYATSLLVVVLLGDETMFARAGMTLRGTEGDPVQGESTGFQAGRHAWLLLGVEGWRDKAAAASSSSMWGVWRKQCALLTRPYLLLPTALFITPITMWTIGMVATISQFVLPPPEAGGYGFSMVALAMLYFAPIVGTLLAETWGHWFNDVLARRHMARYGIECRLTATYPAVVVGAVGLVLFGQTLEHHLSWVGLALGWAMLCFNTLANMTAVSAYLLDCLPRHAALTGAWLNFGRVVGGFSVAYFQLPWFHRNGAALSFGLQAVVMVGATLVIAATQVWGRTWRARFPAPHGGADTD
ncbi:polyamine transporter 3 [Corynascus novoguineensis]|uniref:Polyamine transporter 3 n=1 Tax=Corynascus novoguineensis TaxID=1126955 RepID=A0AAN7HN41_9PEZI|nr:polyamine transporter 3 [Corynascus novoguineensis]